jgi:hypothetical protein
MGFLVTSESVSSYREGRATGAEGTEAEAELGVLRELVEEDEETEAAATDASCS